MNSSKSEKSVILTSQVPILESQINKAKELAEFLLKDTAYANYLIYDCSPVFNRNNEVVGAVYVNAGELPDLEVTTGRTLEDKPLIRHPVTKRRYKGSGRYGPIENYTPVERKPTEADFLMSATSNYRETVSYRESFEHLFPAGGDITDRGSLAWWFDQAWAAAEGSPQLVDCPHPDQHPAKSKSPLKHIVAFKKEANLIFKMIELAVGKAQQTVNVNVNEKKLVESLEHRVIDVRLQNLNPADIAQRIDMITDYGYGKEEIIDIPAGTHPTEEVPA